MAWFFRWLLLPFVFQIAEFREVFNHFDKDKNQLLQVSQRRLPPVVTTRV